jgi:hypothetical protein
MFSLAARASRAGLKVGAARVTEARKRRAGVRRLSFMMKG